MNDILQPVVGSEGIGNVPRWAVMWGVAAMLFLASKVVTLMEVRRAGREVTMGAALAYLFLWVGMDGREFFGGFRRLERVAAAPGLVKMFLGGILLWGVAPFFGGVVSGWVGMIGMVLMLHFGLFHLLAGFWRARGVGVEPIMNRPLHAKSLAEFWGERWNRAYNELMYRFVFRAAVPWAGAAGAMLVVFLVSGLIHDVVISVPASGGYGLPTAYFLIQGMGLLLQRMKTARKFGLATGIKGRLFTAIILIAPLPLLFHAGFINEVILPFMEVIGAGPAQTIGGRL
jgi:alginate O-acetyltransferase complex protein AlgI